MTTRLVRRLFALFLSILLAGGPASVVAAFAAETHRPKADPGGIIGSMKKEEEAARKEVEKKEREAEKGAREAAEKKADEIAKQAAKAAETAAARAAEIAAARAAAEARLAGQKASEAEKKRIAEIAAAQAAAEARLIEQKAKEAERKRAAEIAAKIAAQTAFNARTAAEKAQAAAARLAMRSAQEAARKAAEAAARKAAEEASRAAAEAARRALAGKDHDRAEDAIKEAMAAAEAAAHKAADEAARRVAEAAAKQAAMVHASSMTAAMQKDVSSLAELAGWDAHGLGDAVVKNMRNGRDYVSASLVSARFSCDVVLFRGSRSGRHAIALLFKDDLRPSTLASAASGTPLDDLVLGNAAFILVPPGDPAGSTLLPQPVKDHTGAAQADLVVGVNAVATASLAGEPKKLADLLGAPDKMRLTGTLGAGLLTGAESGPRLSNGFLEALDLSLSLPAGLPGMKNKPSFLSFGNTRMRVQGSKEEGRPSQSTETEARVNAGSFHVSFPRVSLSRSSSGGLALESPVIDPPSGFPSIPLSGARIAGISLAGGLSALKISGSFSSGGKPSPFSVDLSQTQPQFSFDAAHSLSDLLGGWSIPGLESLQVTNVSVGAAYTSGSLSLAGIPATFVAFPVPGSSKKAGALLFPGDLKLSSFIPSLAGTALDGLTLTKPAFLLGPSDSRGASVALPSPVSSHIGLPSLPLKAGINLQALASFEGAIKSLLGAVGAGSSGLKLSGIAPASFLAPAGSSPSPSYLSGLDLSIPLPSGLPSLTKPAFLTLGESSLRLREISGAAVADVASSARLSVGGTPVSFPSLSLSADSGGGIALSAPSISAPDGLLKLPVPGAALTALSFSGVIGGASPSLNLAGTFTVGGSPEEFTASLTGTGKDADYLISLTSPKGLTGLAGWSVPGLESVSLTNVTFATDHVSGALTLRGVPATVVLYKENSQNKNNAAVLFPGTLSLATLAPSLASTPLADLSLSQAAVIVVPAENAASASALPAVVTQQVGAVGAQLKAGVNLAAKASFSGEAAKLMSLLGAQASDIPLSGTVAPTLLSGSESGSAPSAAFLDALDLSFPLPRALPSLKLPGFITVADAKGEVKGESDSSGKPKPALKAKASVSMTFGSTALSFPSISLAKAADGTLSIDSPNIPLPQGLIDKLSDLPVPGASITGIDLSVKGLKGPTPSFSLDFIGAGDKQCFSAKITEAPGGKSTYEITITGTKPLSDLLGWKAPGLEDVSVGNISFGTGFVEGDISIAGVPFDVAVFTAGSKKALALTYASPLKLSTLLPALGGTPLDDLSFSKTAFLFGPAGGAGDTTLPPGVSRITGKSSMNIGSGLSLAGSASLSGQAKALLDKVGLGSQSLPVGGRIDPSLFKGGSALASAFLSMLDLKIPLGDIKFPGTPSGFDLKDSSLALKGAKDGITATVAADAHVTVGGKSFAIPSTISVADQGGVKTFSIAGSSDQTWANPFGLPGITIRSLAVSATFGGETILDVTGKTDLGSVKGLDVSVDFSEVQGQQADASLKLTGADIPLSVLPGIGKIPGLSSLSFRDVTISNREFGGTVKTSDKLFKAIDGLTAVVFKSAAGDNLAVFKNNFSLGDILAVPGPGQALLGKVRFDEASFVLSEAGVNGRVSDLPPAAQAALLKIYGSLGSQISLANGINIVTKLDPSVVMKKAAEMGAPKSIALQGGIGGVFGGTPSLDLSAAIPPITMPKELKFLAMPSNMSTSFFIKLQESLASAGFTLDTTIGLKAKDRTLYFDGAVTIDVDTEGGVTFSLTGKDDSAISDFLGIKGLTLEPGTLLTGALSADSQLTVGFIANTKMGTRTVDLSASLGILGFETVDTVTFDGKVSLLQLSDLVALSDAAVRAGGGHPPASNLPSVKLTGVEVGFASPGAADLVAQSMGLTNGGTRVTGKLWIVRTDKPVASFNAQIGTNGFAIDGEVDDIPMGPLTLKSLSVDSKGTVMPPTPPYIKLVGTAKIFKKDEKIEVAFSPVFTELAADIDLGKLMKFDFRAQAGAAGNDLSKADLSLDAKLKADLSAWLADAGEKKVSAAFQSFADDIKKARQGLSDAQKAVDTLNGKIAAAKDKARKVGQDRQTALANAKKKVDDLKSQIDSLKKGIADDNGRIHTCNYKKTDCVKVFGKKVCAEHADLKRDAECTSDNVRYRADQASKGTRLGELVAAKETADAVLTGLQKDNKNIDYADTDPAVIALEGELVTAKGALQVAQDACAGLETADEQIKRTLDALAKPGNFELKDSFIQGSLRRCMDGGAVLMGLDVAILGHDLHARFALKPTDPVYTENQLGALALLVANKAIEADPKASKVIKDLVNNAYLAAQKKVDDEVAQALRENGLN